MPYFFDTSAVVKIYHQETGTDQVLPLYRGGEVIVISELSKVEFASTIHKKLRTSEITPTLHKFSLAQSRHSGEGRNPGGSTKTGCRPAPA